MAELSDDLYSANPSAVSCETANQIMKDGLRSVIMSKLAFDAFKEFGSSAATSEHDSSSLLLEPVVALLEEELTNGEVPVTTAFCKDSKIRASASNRGLTAHGQWTFSQTRVDGRKTRPRSDVVFVRDETDPPFDEDTMERTPVALLEVGVAKGKGSTSSDDKWFEKLGQGTRYIDLMNNNAVAGQKRKLEEIKDSQESFVGSQGTVPAEENEGSEDRKVSCWRQNFVCFSAQLNKCANLCFLLIRRYIAPTTVVLGLLQDLPLYTIARCSSPLEKLK
jgi:hypothetical protein